VNASSLRELTVLAMAGAHPCIVEPYGASVLDSTHPSAAAMTGATGIPPSRFGAVALALELCPGGDLLQLLQARSQSVERSAEPGRCCVLEQEAREVCAGMCCAVHYLHLRGFAHGDIKPENVLLATQVARAVPASPSSPGLIRAEIVRLCDFGAASDARARAAGDQCATSAEYIAPEAARAVRRCFRLRGHSRGDRMSSMETYDPCRADVWSVGVLIATLLRGRSPFVFSLRAGSHHRGHNPMMSSLESEDFLLLEESDAGSVCNSQSASLPGSFAEPPASPMRAASDAASRSRAPGFEDLDVILEAVPVETPRPGELLEAKEVHPADEPGSLLGSLERAWTLDPSGSTAKRIIASVLDPFAARSSPGSFSSADFDFLKAASSRPRQQASSSSASSVMPFSTDCVDLLSKLLHPDPSRRWTLGEALSHPWISPLVAHSPTTTTTGSEPVYLPRAVSAFRSRLSEWGAVSKSLRAAIEAITPKLQPPTLHRRTPSAPETISDLAQLSQRLDHSLSFSKPGTPDLTGDDEAPPSQLHSHRRKRSLTTREASARSSRDPPSARFVMQQPSSRSYAPALPTPQETVGLAPFPGLSASSPRDHHPLADDVRLPSLNLSRANSAARAMSAGEPSKFFSDLFGPSSAGYLLTSSTLHRTTGSAASITGSVASSQGVRASPPPKRTAGALPGFSPPSSPEQAPM
jgi:serine/threonine protein kinase